MLWRETLKRFSARILKRDARIFLLVIVSATAVNGQHIIDSPREPNLTIINASWIAYGGDWELGYGGWPSGSYVTSVAGAISLGVSTFHASGNQVYYPASGEIHVRGGRSRDPVKCIARVTLQNTSTKTVKGFDLDYVFLDPQTDTEFLRYSFHSKDTLRPGKSRKVTQEIYQNAGRYRRRYSPLKPEADTLLRTKESLVKIVFKRVQYSDGSTWQRP